MFAIFFDFCPKSEKVDTESAFPVANPAAEPVLNGISGHEARGI